MNQNERFNDILNECLDQLLKGEKVEQCLKNYPEHAAELEPLLRTAIAARVASTIRPRAELKSRARYEFQAAARDIEAKKSSRRSFFSWHWQWQSGWAIALVAVVLVVLGGGSTVVVAGSSMPDNALYSVKLTTEQIQLALSRSDVGKAELNSRFAGRRAEEIVYMASKGDVQEVRIIAQRLNTNLENITNIVSVNTGPEAVSPRVVGGAAPDTGGASSGPMLSVNSSPAELNDQSATPAEPRMGIAAAPTAPPNSDAAQPAPLLVAPMPAAAPAPEAPPAISPAAVPAPAASEPPMAAPAPAPASVAAPAPAVRAPAPEATVAPQPESSSKSISQEQNTGTITGSNLNLTDREKIEQIIIDAFNTRQALLEKALENSSPEVRPAIRQAIAQSLAEYEKALSQLEQAGFAN